MRASPIQTSFNTGEVSQLMLGRVDFEQLRSGLTVCENSFPQIQGPWTRRPGFHFCDEVKDSSQPTRSVAFKYNTGQSYALEFGHLYVRFKKNRAPVYDLALTITNISSGSPGILTYTGTDPANGDDIDLSGLAGPLAVLNGLRVRVANVNTGANTFEMTYVSGANVNTSLLGAYTSGGTASRVYTLTTPYEAADVFQLKFARSVDRMYVFHQDYPEASINRFGDASWTHTPLVFIDGPYLPVNKTSTTLGISDPATGAGRTVTASSIVGINDDTGFQTTDVGRYIRRKSGTIWGYALITARASTTVVTVTVITTWTATTANVDWRLGLLSDTTGYSACGSFFGDRLFIGGVEYRPNRLDGSYVGDYLNFAETEPNGTTTDSHAVSRSLPSEDVQRIRWMKGTADGLAVGTSEGEWLLSASVNGEAITPTNVNGKESTGWGSDDTEPVKVATALMFIQAGSRRVRELEYQFVDNKMTAPDVTVLSDHITKGPTTATSGLVELAFQKERVPIVWGPRKDGRLVGITYSKADKVLGAHRHTVGGFSDPDDTQPAKVKSCCTIPAADGSYTELWVITEYHIGGRTVQYHEYLTNIWEKGDNQLDAFFLDSGISYTGPATQTITGLHHLAGETIQCLVNGANHPDVAVDVYGRATLNADAMLLPTLTAHFGYKYKSDGATLRQDVGAADGTAQGKIQRTHRMGFRLLDTLGLEVGPSFTKLQLLTFRDSSMLSGQMTPLFTGDKVDIPWQGGYTTENVVCWRVQQPLPATVLCVMPQLNTEDR